MKKFHRLDDALKYIADISRLEPEKDFFLHCAMLPTFPVFHVFKEGEKELNGGYIMLTVKNGYIMYYQYERK